ncbi:hypothetical protein DFH08DRAFT_916197 [Mycena albidolilacea]|uniref:NAD(P)-binding protein n=1 Tax=Mycena albidolilacea TaxID=1033008 RepID=A0AAD7EMH5_9AGAR|nr:hypothetical protein DFH08DRAFT_916197 [Mycena albidolilacea]
MSGKNVYLVSGANRGIGYGLAAAIAARPNTIVFGGARDPTAQSPKELAAKHPNVHSVKITSGDKVDDEAAIAEIQKTARQLDVEINTLGLIVLFQTVNTLLSASPTGAPKFIYISSSTGSVRRYMNMSASASGSSRTVANFLIKALDVENPSLITLAISPGWLATDMGNEGAREDGVAGILSRIDGATNEKSSGRFWNYQVSNDGNPWDIETDEVPW